MPKVQKPELGQAATVHEEINRLYYGDNLDILQRYVKDESVDLVYLDPPFNSNATYNVLFAEQDGTRAAAQIKAFGDTWQWDQAAAAAYMSAIDAGGRVAEAMVAFRSFLGDTNMLAYLSMMAPRLIELRRVLKPAGSIYLHCDPTASHYLKMLLDAVFGADCFLNEIIWKRTGSHNSAQRFGPVHDVIFYYGKSEEPIWNQQYQPYDAEYLGHFKKIDEKTGLQFQDVALTGPGTRQGPSGQPWRGHDPTPKGRHWQPASYLYTKYRELTGEDLAQYEFIQRLDRLDAVGLIYWGDRGGLPRYKQFLKDAPGAPMADVWTGIDVINSQAAERLGYPTQKPEALLERIIKASSNEGGVVLDPFCGCGTAIASAQKLKRHWIGIDITHLAITLIKHRLQDAFGDKATYQVVGEPVSSQDAQTLADDDKYQFQWWALGLVGARPTEQKKGADKGIDGRLYFHDDKSGKTKQIILSVKGGGVTVAHLRDLRGVIDREGAAIGVLLTMEPITKPMKTEAAGAGFYESLEWGKFPRLQIYTVEELLAGAMVKYPPTRANVTFRKAAKHEGPVSKSGKFDFDAEN